MRHVVVPQAVTKIPAPMLNELISLLKDTTLVSVIALNEAVLVGREILAEDLQQLGADPDRDLVPDHHPAPGPSGRQTDRPQPARKSRAAPTSRSPRSWPSRCSACVGSTSASASSRCCKGIDLEVARGEVVCVLGPSGSGKSTLLRCVNLLEPPEEGEIFLEGHDICKGPDSGSGEQSWELDFVRQRVGMVFQQFNLFPHRSVAAERDDGAGQGARQEQGGGGGEGHGRCSNGSASPTSSTSTPNDSPAASSSGSRSPGRWRWNRA